MEKGFLVSLAVTAITTLVFEENKCNRWIK